MDDILYWMWMADVLGPGSPHSGAALAWCGDARNFYAAIRAGYRPAFLHRHMQERAAQLEPGDLQARLDACIAAGAAVLTPDDPDYPRRFLPLSDLPLVLYLTGSSACLNDRRYVAMVGTRRPTPYGQRACRELSRQMAEQGAVIVSGMADGLDGVAQAAAVEAGAPTIAFLGTAIDRTYPAAHAPLRAAIERLGGAVASEYPPGFSGRMQGTFLARNRLIAAMGGGPLRGGGRQTQRHHEHRQPCPALRPAGAGGSGQHFQPCQRGHQRHLAGRQRPDALRGPGHPPGNGACTGGKSVAQ